MSKPSYKKHIVLEGGKFLGALVFYKDKKNRPCFKFSIKKKIHFGDLWVQDLATGVKKSFLKEKPKEMSYDASYKFADNLFELKTEESGKKPRTLMTEVPVPPQNYLFLVRVRNWHELPVISTNKNTLELVPPWSCNEIVIFFSFAGTEGKPFMPESEYLKPIEGKTIFIDLPLNPPFNKLWIGIGEDSGNKEPYDLTIKAPNYRSLKHN